MARHGALTLDALLVSRVATEDELTNQAAGLCDTVAMCAAHGDNLHAALVAAHQWEQGRRQASETFVGGSVEALHALVSGFGPMGTTPQGDALCL